MKVYLSCGGLSLNIPTMSVMYKFLDAYRLVPHSEDYAVLKQLTSVHLKSGINDPRQTKLTSTLLFYWKVHKNWSIFSLTQQLI